MSAWHEHLHIALAMLLPVLVENLSACLRWTTVDAATVNSQLRLPAELMRISDEQREN
jgi:hypothetical protein